MKWFMHVISGRTRNRMQRDESLERMATLAKQTMNQAADESTAASGEVSAAVARRVDQSTTLRDVVAGVIRTQRKMDAHR